jgi:hypothetical protein
MITMLSNSLIEQLNVIRRTRHIAMKVVSADSFCSVVWGGASAACAKVSTGSVEASKARPAAGAIPLPVYMEDFDINLSSACLACEDSRTSH